MFRNINSAMHKTFTCKSTPWLTSSSERENALSCIASSWTKKKQSLSCVLWAPESDATHFHLGVAYLVGRPNGGMNS